MQRFFTKQLLLWLFVSSSVGLMAQDPYNNFKVTAPASVAGNYDVVQAAFGATTSDPLSGECAAGDPALACEALVNGDAVMGKIAFVNRGTCQFGLKALNAQNAGAIAVVICNNAPGGGAIGMPGGDFGADVTVPVVSMSLEDCTVLKAALDAGELQGTFEFKCGIDEPAPEGTFWGLDPGQGDFTDGLGDWIVSTDDEFLEDRTLWVHTADGRPIRNRFGAQLQSISGCTGAAVFDLENLQTEDNPTFVFPYNNFYQATLTSPAFDCSNAEYVSVQFYMINLILNTFSGQTGRYAEIQFFDGESWGDPRPLPTNAWGTTVTQKVVIAAPELVGKSNCRMRFWKGGDFGFLMIDDVFVFDKKNVDIRVNADYVATTPTYMVPASQVSPMPFLSDISNIGNAEAADVKLSVEIRNSNGDLIETLVNDYGQVASLQTIENIPFPNLFTPPAEPGLYRGTYIISSPDEEGNEGNNTFEFQFEVSDNKFSRLLSDVEFGQDYLAGFPNNFIVDVSSYYSVGNVYYVENGADYRAVSANFGLANAVADIDNEGFVKVDLFELNSIDGLADPAERTHVGTGEIFITTDELGNFRDIEVPLSVPNIEGGYDPENADPIRLKDQTHYFVVAHAEPFQTSTPTFEFLGARSGTGNAYVRSLFHWPVGTAFDSLGIARFQGSYHNREGSSDAVDERLGRSFTQQIWGGGTTLVNTYLPLTIDRVSSTYDIAAVGEVSLFPNPASREFYVDVTLEKPSDEVRIDLVTMDGRVAMSRTYNHVHDSRLKFDLGGVPSGTYTAMIHTENGVLNKKVVVQQ